MNSAAKVFIALTWLLPIGGAAVGGLVLVTGFAKATGAPQEAVVCALACACAVLPYCFARGLTEIIRTFAEKGTENTSGPVAKSKPKYNYQTLGIDADR